MFLAPNVSMVMTRPCRSWRRERPIRAASGPTSGTIDRSEGSHRRLRCITRDRRQEHPERHLKTFTCILQADAYGGYNPLFKVDRDPGPLTQALCCAHSRRKFFVLADIATNAKRGKNAAPISPMALEAVKRIDSLFDIEREINGLAADQRLERRRKESLPLVVDMQALASNRAGKALPQFSGRRSD